MRGGSTTPVVLTMPVLSVALPLLLGFDMKSWKRAWYLPPHERKP
jgi:hypothetical protein